MQSKVFSQDGYMRWEGGWSGGWEVNWYHATAKCLDRMGRGP